MDAVAYVTWCFRQLYAPAAHNGSDEFHFLATFYSAKPINATSEHSQLLTIVSAPRDDPQRENWRDPISRFKAMPCMGLKCTECD